MIELACKNIIDNLGATGLLVIGLYFVLYRPLTRMAYSLNIINHELERVITLLERAMDKKD